MQEGKRTAGLVSKVMLASVASKGLGFLRETVIAAVFGASKLTDAYLVASTIPMMLFSGFQNALQTTVIPVFTDIMTNSGKKSAMAMVNSLINLVLMISIAFTALGMLVLPWVVQLLAPGFESELQTLTVRLSRIMFPLIAFWVLTGIISGLLNTFAWFTIPALIGIPFNLIIIISVFTLGKSFGIEGLAWGTLLAVAGQLVFLLPGYLQVGFRWEASLNFRDPGVRRIMKLSVPVLLSSVLTQLTVITNRILGSGLEVGSIAALNFADRVNALALGMFASTIATVFFPSLAKEMAAGQLEQFKQQARSGLSVVSYLILPITVVMFVLADPIIQVFFQRGAFSVRATELTATALRYYAVGSLAVALRIYLEKVYYSMKDALTPMLLGSGTLLLNIILSIVLVKYLELGGLALSTSIAQTIYMLIALGILVRRAVLHWRDLIVPGAKMLIGCLGMTLGVYGGGLIFRPIFAANFSGQFGFIVLTGALGLIIYFLLTYALKAQESLWLWNTIRQRFN